MNLNIRKGQFVCIIGDVGSGKSSLLSSLIGDLLHLPYDVLQKHEDQLIGREKWLQELLVQEADKNVSHDCPIVINDSISYV